MKSCGKAGTAINLKKGSVSKMTKTAAKAKPALIALTLGLLLSTTSVKNYVCGKNPYVKPTKLTWLLSTCKQAGSLLAQAREAEEMMLSQATIFGYKSLTELGTALGGQEQKDIDDLIKTITDGEAAMKKTLCKKGK
jgi:hypothetical protein